MMGDPPSPPDLALTVGGLRLTCPVLPASGTFGIGHARVFDPNRLGAIVPKTITPQARTGRPTPRIAETGGGLVNAIGIPSPGLDRFIAEVLPLYKGFTPPLIVSLSADTAEEFAAAAAVLARQGIDGLELNLSCPNIEGDGHLFAANPRAAAAVTAACRAAVSLPLWCKLSPVAAAPADIAKACEDAGADALIAGNTLPALALGENGAPLLGAGAGGLSGPPLKPVALRHVSEVSRASTLPVIGCGGVATLKDALDHFNVGAKAVAVGSATLSRPTAMVRLIDALADWTLATQTSGAVVQEGRARLGTPPETTPTTPLTKTPTTPLPKMASAEPDHPVARALKAVADRRAGDEGERRRTPR